MTLFRPMKSADVESVDKLKFPLLASTKYDGVYCTVRDGQLLGRSLKPVKNKYVSNILSNPLFEGFVGEICHTIDGKLLGLNRDDLCRSTTSCINSHNKEWTWMWLIFDFVHPEVIDLPYEERMAYLSNYLYGSSLYIHYPILDVILYKVNSGEEVLTLYQQEVDAGFEGLILRDPKGMWKNGRSTLSKQEFLRMKPSGDAEAVVYGVQEALQNNNEAEINELGYTERSSHQANKVGKGIVGAFLCIDVETGREIKVSAGKMLHEERKECFQSPPIGAIVKYRSLLTGVKDSPRHARWIGWRNVEDMDEALVEKVEEIVSNLSN